MITVRISGRDFKGWLKTLKGAGFKFNPDAKTWTGDESKLLDFQVRALQSMICGNDDYPVSARDIDGAQTLAEWQARRAHA